MTKKLLTEAEILKMSDKDYMNEDQLAFFRNKLEQLQAEILRNAGQTTENLRETVIVPDPADRATIEEEHALELRTRDRDEHAWRGLFSDTPSDVCRCVLPRTAYCSPVPRGCGSAAAPLMPRSNPPVFCLMPSGGS